VLEKDKHCNLYAFIVEVAIIYLRFSLCVSPVKSFR
jgi:hypothetical protein